jgi:hypothetical protein
VAEIVDDAEQRLAFCDFPTDQSMYLKVTTVELPSQTPAGYVTRLRD